MADNNFTPQGFNDGTLPVEDTKRAEYNARVRETRKENLAAWKQAFEESVVETSGAIKEQLSTRSNDIEVVKALTFGEGGYIDRKDDSGNVIEKEPVPNVVGYLVRNVSATPIPCYTTACQLVDGVYMKTPVETSIAPGGTLALRKVDFVTLMSAPEFSFECANGKVTARKKFTGTSQAELENFLEKHNFLPSNCKVGDMIEQISTSVDGVETVLPDYESTFAFLMNKTEKKQRAAGTKQPAISTQALAANYVRRLIAGPAMQN